MGLDQIESPGKLAKFKIGTSIQFLFDVFAVGLHGVMCDVQLV